MKLLLALLAKGGLGKLLMTGGTMLISMAVYALNFGWPYAVGFVLLILVHELGHFIAACQSGLNVGAPVFIPFRTRVVVVVCPITPVPRVTDRTYA